MNYSTNPSRLGPFKTPFYSNGVKEGVGVDIKVGSATAERSLLPISTYLLLSRGQDSSAPKESLQLGPDRGNSGPWSDFIDQEPYPHNKRCMHIGYRCQRKLRCLCIHIDSHCIEQAVGVRLIVALPSGPHPIILASLRVCLLLCDLWLNRPGLGHIPWSKVAWTDDRRQRKGQFRSVEGSDLGEGGLWLSLILDIMKRGRVYFWCWCACAWLMM